VQGVEAGIEGAEGVQMGNQQQILRNDELMKTKIAQGGKLVAGGHIVLGASEAIRSTRDDEDEQDYEANSKHRRIDDLDPQNGSGDSKHRRIDDLDPSNGFADSKHRRIDDLDPYNGSGDSKRRRVDIVDPHNGSGNTPSHAPGSHMDESERMRFVSDDATVEQSLGYKNNSIEVGDAPSKLLQFAHKSLMAGLGVDISTQIPMVTAARGNFLRHLAEVSAMY
jgi:hypothetical protein